MSGDCANVGSPSTTDCSLVMPFLSPPDPQPSDPIGAVLQRHFSPSVQVKGVYSLRGHLHSINRIVLSNGDQLLLKCSPGPTTPLLRREQLLLETEARALSILKQSETPYIPSFVHYGLQGGSMGSAFLMRHYVTGSTLQEMEPRLTIQDRDGIDRALGSLAYRIGQHASDSFGSLEQVACGSGKRSWREAFVTLLEGILRDSEDAFVHLPYAEIRHQVRRLSPALEEVTSPRLVVVGLGQPSQVLLNPESKQLSGLIGLEYALWGDVQMAEIFGEPSPAVLEGFGSRLTEGRSHVARQLLYACYRSVHKVTIHYYRDQGMTTEMDARRQLTSILSQTSSSPGVTAPQSEMAHFLRGKQAGIQKDFSENLSPDLFNLEDFARCGINSQISAIAYDPVQSLLAVGTSDTQFGQGQIYIFGQRRVAAVFALPRKASAKFIQFCADKLVSVDSKSEITIYSLATRQTLVSYAPPTHASALLTDPSLDYAFIGLQNGDIIAYDLDRETLTPFRVPNLWAQRNPRARLCPVVSLSFSPRDIGKILVGYPEGAVTFSFKQNVAQKYFEYEVPPGALGGNGDVPSPDLRRPRLTRALWHPNGIFVLTVHDDNSLVFWDSKDGRKIMARSIQNPNVDQPGVGPEQPPSPGTSGMKDPITNVVWCVKDNGDDSGLLIAGGRPKAETTKGLSFIDLGPSPNYQTSSWAIISKHFESPKRNIVLPTPPGAQVVDFCAIPRSTPYYGGAHDPIALIALLSSGEVITMSFPSGHPITPTNMVHPYLSFVQPFVNKAILTPVDRSAWLGLKERRSQGPKFLLGGAEANKSLKRFEDRNVLTTAHADGTIRIWDAGNDDEIENGEVVQVDLARAVGRVGNIEVTEMSLGGSTGELSVGLKTGELVVFRWGTNQSYGREEPPGANEGPGKLTKISHRVDPGLEKGVLPLTLLNMQQGPVTALKHSQVGFVAVGFEGGGLAIIDLRGPAIIHTAHFSELLKVNKRSSIFNKRSSSIPAPEWPTKIEFGVLSLEGEDYSSICCFVGTNRGNLATFKILPSENGKYMATFVGTNMLDDKVISIIPVNADDGSLALATPNLVGGLRNGNRVNGVVIAVTVSGCRIFKPATSKGAHRSWDDYLCDSAAVVKTEARGYSLVGLFGDGHTRAFSIPGLKEIGSRPINQIADMRRLSDATISSNGTVLVWTSPSEVGLFSVWGTGHGLYAALETPPTSPKANSSYRRPSEDQLYNPQAVIPPRPTITNIQWISGTQYISPADMDILIGGPDRPPSKRMQEQMRQEDEERRRAFREGRTPTTSSTQSGSQEGYWSYMQRQVQERTEKLSFAGDNMDRLEESSSNWAKDVNKFVQNQKKKAVLGALGSKFGI
ncbi:hypothetical protein BO70DRAFT_305892 [Aspergillus heteromorphus CBS 117.55]|uniref:Lethal giant larvae (Lgl)-like C-terminal domain-containing protein n=1 Tax=Aspergillus heteromorphus CBS 117.55 TaxID=1448321 RepID=A0A317X4B6_9EURO|nr:uncharacterized protein BO70DRAFT_305892 [Aspergillus heteromorphus CBS 117.55]PWY92442.1 hypothetical protein BO70DRAFT_305892 [Aspergillus heteromorphus CBS 117.55]